MPHNILITGGSGYLGGTLLANLASSNFAARTNSKLFALVRTCEQAKAVKELYGAEPLTANLQDESAIRKIVLENRITVVFFLIDSIQSHSQVHFLKALAEIKKQAGIEDVHFLHTTGAKLFSSHSGSPTERPLYDDADRLYEIQKALRPPIPLVGRAVDTNNVVTEQGEALGVRTYIFAPCIVYGKGEGFGNKISIQTVAVVQAAKATRQVYSVDEDTPTWPVCHIYDNTTLYIQILESIVLGQSIGHGKKGYYLAASGSVEWIRLYEAIAKALAKRGVVDDDRVLAAGNKEVEQMAKALGCPNELVALQLGGFCTFTARNGLKIGWKPKYAPEHILDDADNEVELILANL